MCASWCHRSGSLARWAVVLLLVNLSLLVPAAARGQTPSTSSATVGSSVVTFTRDWAVFDRTSTGLVLQQRNARRVVFSYIEQLDAPVPITDNAALIASVLRDQPELRSMAMWGAGTLTDGTLWQVHAVAIAGDRFVLVVAGNTEARPGADVVTTLLTEEGRASAAHAASREITVNGQAHAIAAIPPDAIAEVVHASVGAGIPAADTPGASATAESAVNIPEPGDDIVIMYANEATGQMFLTAIYNHDTEERAHQAFDAFVADIAVEDGTVTVFPQALAVVGARVLGTDVDAGSLVMLSEAGTSGLFGMFRVDTLVYVVAVPLGNVNLLAAITFIYAALRGEGGAYLPDGFVWVGR